MHPREVVTAWVDAFDAFNRADAEALADLYHETATYWDKLTFLRQHGLPVPGSG